jgi:hypothetical protein
MGSRDCTPPFIKGVKVAPKAPVELRKASRSFNPFQTRMEEGVIYEFLLRILYMFSLVNSREFQAITIKMYTRHHVSYESVLYVCAFINLESPPPPVFTRHCVSVNIYPCQYCYRCFEVIYSLCSCAEVT